MEQWEAAPKWQRTLYRAAFSPVAFLFVLPMATFGVLHRLVGKWYELLLEAAYLYALW